MLWDTDSFWVTKFITSPMNKNIWLNWKSFGIYLLRTWLDGERMNDRFVAYAYVSACALSFKCIAHAGWSVVVKLRTQDSVHERIVTDNLRWRILQIGSWTRWVPHFGKNFLVLAKVSYFIFTLLLVLRYKSLYIVLYIVAFHKTTKSFTLWRGWRLQICECLYI